MKISRHHPSHATGGFTLLEITFSMAIGSIIALITLIAFIEGLHLFQSNSSEMLARDKGSRVIRQISGAMLSASNVNIYPSYTTASGSSFGYGQCAVITSTAGSNVAYYLYNSGSNVNNGGIYFNSTGSGMNPATDRLILSTVQALEFRADVNGAIRTGFKIGVYDYFDKYTGGYIPTVSGTASHYTATAEANVIRFTTSDYPRN